MNPSRLSTLFIALLILTPTVQGQGLDFETEVVAENLEVPWALAFTPDGRMLLTERIGRIRVVDTDGSFMQRPWAGLNVANPPGRAEVGLMGIAVDPNFEETGYVYACYTYWSEPLRLSNRLVRLQETTTRASNGDLIRHGSDETILIDDILGGFNHNGCRLKFGPDGKLYATMGEAFRYDPAQDLSDNAGKILRLNPDGTVPEDNPFEDSYVWSYGHRNPQGLAFQPGTNRLFSTEHGTNGVNEINIIERGKNYGWPTIQYASGRAETDPRFVDPILIHTYPPAGATFVSSDRYPALKGNLLVATLAPRALLRIVLAPDGTTVSEEELLLEGRFGRLRDIVEGPDGYLYLTTSNRDGRGQPASNDDRIVRLVLR